MAERHGQRWRRRKPCRRFAARNNKLKNKKQPLEEIDEGRGRQEDRISNFRKKKKSTRQEGAGGSNIQFPAEGGGVSSDATTGVSSGRPRPTLDATEPSIILSLPVSSHLVAYLLGETVKATKFLSPVPDYRGASSSLTREGPSRGPLRSCCCDSLIKFRSRPFC